MATAVMLPLLTSKSDVISASNQTEGDIVKADRPLHPIPELTLMLHRLSAGIQLYTTNQEIRMTFNSRHNTEINDEKRNKTFFLFLALIFNL